MIPISCSLENLPVLKYSKTNTTDYLVLIVTAISLNPVFGSLWRAVCNDRDNDAREELVAAFGLQIERLTQEDEKVRMKLWLEQSYD